MRWWWWEMMISSIVLLLYNLLLEYLFHGCYLFSIQPLCLTTSSIFLLLVSLCCTFEISLNLFSSCLGAWPLGDNFKLNSHLSFCTSHVAGSPAFSWCEGGLKSGFPRKIVKFSYGPLWCSSLARDYCKAWRRPSNVLMGVCSVIVAKVSRSNRSRCEPLSLCLSTSSLSHFPLFWVVMV